MKKNNSKNINQTQDPDKDHPKLDRDFKSLYLKYGGAESTSPSLDIWQAKYLKYDQTEGHDPSSNTYRDKYLKYKNKYLQLKQKLGGERPNQGNIISFINNNILKEDDIYMLASYIGYDSFITYNIKKNNLSQEVLKYFNNCITNSSILYNSKSTNNKKYKIIHKKLINDNDINNIINLITGKCYYNNTITNWNNGPNFITKQQKCIMDINELNKLKITDKKLLEKIRLIEEKINNNFFKIQIKNDSEYHLCSTADTSLIGNCKEDSSIILSKDEFITLIKYYFILGDEKTQKGGSEKKNYLIDYLDTIMTAEQKQKFNNVLGKKEPINFNKTLFNEKINFIKNKINDDRKKVGENMCSKETGECINKLLDDLEKIKDVKSDNYKLIKGKIWHIVGYSTTEEIRDKYKLFDLIESQVIQCEANYKYYNTYFENIEGKSYFILIDDSNIELCAEKGKVFGHNSCIKKVNKNLIQFHDEVIRILCMN